MISICLMNTVEILRFAHKDTFNILVLIHDIRWIEVWIQTAPKCTYLIFMSHSHVGISDKIQYSTTLHSPTTSAVNAAINSDVHNDKWGKLLDAVL
jgi:hypothetical protein